MPPPPGGLGARPASNSSSWSKWCYSSTVQYIYCSSTKLPTNPIPSFRPSNPQSTPLHWRSASLPTHHHPIQLFLNRHSKRSDPIYHFRERRRIWFICFNAVKFFFLIVDRDMDDGWVMFALLSKTCCYIKYLPSTTTTKPPPRIT